jgi:hypothetical protein
VTSILTCYDEAGWAALREIADDADAFDDFAELDRKTNALAEQEGAVCRLVLGPRQVRVMSRWVRASGLPNDGAGRCAFIAALKEFFDEPEGTA